MTLKEKIIKGIAKIPFMRGAAKLFLDKTDRKILEIVGKTKEIIVVNIATNFNVGEIDLRNPKYVEVIERIDKLTKMGFIKRSHATKPISAKVKVSKWE
jgi:hypothetical protein